MEERLNMKNGEIDKLKVIHNILKGKLKWREASQQLNLSERQIGRLCVRVGEEGNKGIIHRLRGRKSNHRLVPGLVLKAINLVRKEYSDFGPTFANEKLRKIHKIKISIFSLRQGMIHEGLWECKKKKTRHRSWRERRPCIGELIQLDGSDHDWFEGRGPRCALLAYIDDATSRILYAEFVPVENTENLLRATEAYLRKRGRPMFFYVDKDSIYRVNREAPVEEEIESENRITQFSRAMRDLGIGMIFANSPQAKGRVERSFKTHQDRLVKELRLAGISTISAANRFLLQTYLPDHNHRCAVAPSRSLDAHRPLLKSHRLKEILSVRIKRTLMNDFTVQHKNRCYQLQKDQRVVLRPKIKIQIEYRLDGSTHLRFKGIYLNFKAIGKRPYRSQASRTHVTPRTPKPGTLQYARSIQVSLS